MARFPAFRRLTWLVLWIVLGLGADTALAGLAKSPGKGFTRIDELGRSYGLQASGPGPGRQLHLRSRWTTLSFEAGSREAAWNGIRLFLGEPVLASGNALYLSPTDHTAVIRPLLDPLAVPAPGALEFIVIDPGHGGSDPGTGSRQLQEKTFTLDVARRLQQDLVQRGYRVMLTRTSDVRLARTQVTDLRRRIELANRADADLFISIHFNSLPGNPTVSGIETYALTPAGQSSTAMSPRDRTVYPGNRQDHWNAVLSAAIHRKLLAELGAVDRGLKRARFAVLRPSECPAVLIEAGFLSNPAEARKISTPSYRQVIAEAIGEGIDDYGARLREAAAVE
ncbi:MAG: N-acetylmuramoyl-L-alanine amidase [Lacunisphaera sp.]|nr:N-acetylmuramoyl-L-alanine amidase [Lacunisphaera sp.]